MGGLVSLFAPAAEEEEEVSLFNLLERNDPLPWNLIFRKLQNTPEEAAAYAHFQEYSPLQRALIHPRIPLYVVKEFVEAYEDAVLHSVDGESVLQTAVKHQEDFNVVEFLLQQHPEAARLRDNQKRLPLFGVRYSAEMCQLLLQAYPAGAFAQDDADRTALHYVCAGRVLLPEEEPHHNHDDSILTPQLTLAPADPQVIQRLVEAAQQHGRTDGGVLSPDVKGTTPLQLLCQHLAATLEQQNKNITISQQQQQQHEEEEEKDEGTCRLWESLLILVHAAAATFKNINNEDHSNFQLVHSLIRLNCPPIIVQHSLSLYPEDAYQRDGKGRTPLMVAARMATAASSSNLIKQQGDDKHNTTATLCVLLQSHPAAARMTDKEGRLPIDILSEGTVSRHNELWELLVKAEPKAVDTRDLRDKMFPFLTAAAHAPEDDVNTVYCLLRAKPHVLRLLTEHTHPQAFPDT